MDTLASQRRKDSVPQALPWVLSWEERYSKAEKAAGEGETLKVISSSQSSNLERSNFKSAKLRMIFKIAQGQNGTYLDTGILWNAVIISLGGQTLVLYFGLHPADTGKLARLKWSHGMFRLKIDLIRAARSPSFLGNQVPKSALDLDKVSL